MEDRDRFMEILNGLSECAQKNGGVLDRSEVEKGFLGMELTEEQYDMIYRYLFGKKITIKGIRLKPYNNRTEPGTGIDDGELEDSRYLNLYYGELDGLKCLTEKERLSLAMRLLSGEEDVMRQLLDASLHEVVEIAKEYRGRGAHLEDMIQEGNLALIQVLTEMTGKGKCAQPLVYIREYVRCAIAEYIDGEVADGDGKERVVAKLGLLHEAAKHLAKENGVLPGVRELAEFTKLSAEEIRELVLLSKDVDFLGRD
ncbi:MAG: hypothetical protein K2N63_11895 [Lachnospiraceae bacterium]|nr:hypothetical protein [Lachnospiraceae bacterium]